MKRRRPQTPLGLATSVALTGVPITTSPFVQRGQAVILQYPREVIILHPLDAADLANPPSRIGRLIRRVRRWIVKLWRRLVP